MIGTFCKISRFSVLKNVRDKLENFGRKRETIKSDRIFSSVDKFNSRRDIAEKRISIFKDISEKIYNLILRQKDKNYKRDSKRH